MRDPAQAVSQLIVWMRSVERPQEPGIFLLKCPRSVAPLRSRRFFSFFLPGIVLEDCSRVNSEVTQQSLIRERRRDSFAKRTAIRVRPDPERIPRKSRVSHQALPLSEAQPIVIIRDRFHRVYAS